MTTTFIGIETLLVETKYFRERMKLKCAILLLRVCPKIGF